MSENTNEKSTSDSENEIPNETTLAALKEAEEMKKHPEKYKWYTDVDELIKDLLKE